MSDLDAYCQQLAAAEPEDPATSRAVKQLALQIRALQNLIDREDYEPALRMMADFPGFGLPQDFVDTWTGLAEPLRKELEKLKANRLENWSNDVNELVKDTQAACLDAKSSADLDGLLIRCSALQLRVRPNNNTVLSQRVSRKLAGASETLAAWADYLDFLEAGDSKRAGDALRRLVQGASGLPVLSSEQIAERLGPIADDNSSIESHVAEILADVQTPDDLPEALQKLVTYLNSPLLGQNTTAQYEVQRLRSFIEAWRAARERNVSETIAQLNSSQLGSLDIRPLYSSIAKQIRDRLLREAVSQWGEFEQQTGESDSAYLSRIVDELNSRHEYAKLRDALAFSARYLRTDESQGSRVMIDCFLGGQRLEEAGDFAAAVTNYRIVVASSAEFAPTEAAQEGLRRIKDHDPSFLTDDMRRMNGLLERLSKQIQSITPPQQ